MPLDVQIRKHQMLSLMLFTLFIITMINVRAFSAQQPQDSNQLVRVRIYSMRSITAQQAKDYFAQTKIPGTVVIIPGTSAISVTTTPQNLVYASSVLKVVDNNEPFEIKFVDIEPNKQLPAGDDVAKKLGSNFSISTLLEGTGNTPLIKVIVDKYENKLLIISPKSQTENVIKVINELIVAADKKAAEEKIADSNVADGNITDSNNAADSNAAMDTEVKEVVSTLLNESAKDTNAAETKTVISEANEQVKNNKRVSLSEDEVLNEFMTELADAAKAEKEAKLKTEAAIDKEIEPAKEIITEKQPSQPELLKTEQITLGIEVNEPVKQAKVESNEPVIKKMDIPNGEEFLELNLPEKLEIVALIDLVGRYLNLNYLYDDTKITGSVTVKVQGKIRVRELYSLLESVLKFRGFAMSRKGNLVTIAPAAETLDLDPRIVENGIQPGDIAVTKVFHLNYINTAAAKRLLIEMKLGANITEIPETGTLVITEYAFRMQRIDDLLKLVDVQGPPKEFKLRVLKYTLAESLVTKIKALAEQLGTVEVTIGVSEASSSAATTPGGARTSRSPRTTAQPSTPSSSSTDTATKGVFVDFDKRTNRVLMIGLAGELASVDKIIDSLDVPQQDLRVIREYEIQYIDIQQIVDALKNLGIIDAAVNTGSTGTSKKSTTTMGSKSGETVTQPTITNAASASGDGASAANLLDQPQVVMLEATNSLLVNATPEQHIQISQIISYIDREAIQAAIPYKIYRLENQDPEELAETLNGLIQKTVSDAEGKIQQTVKYTEENIVIVPDKNTFSLVVYASKKNQEWIGSLIKSLDRRRPQVLIDVSLVEITQTDAFEFDMDVVANAKGLVTDNVEATSISSSAGGNREASFTSGTTLGYFSNDKIQALFSLIDSKEYGRVLARPKVLVNDNEEGTISTEDTRYVGQTTATTVAGTTTTDSVVESTTFTPYTAKIELKITPQISEGNLLRLEIEMERNDFQEGTSTTVNGIESPLDEKKSTVNTIVTVPDGSTIILGGLTKLNQQKTTSKVPLLGDIPVAGALFRNASKSVGDSKLYIFVKANILRPEETAGMDQLKDISEKYRGEFEKAESEFQNYELFPGVKDKPIDPNRVLEQ